MRSSKAIDRCCFTLMVNRCRAARDWRRAFIRRSCGWWEDDKGPATDFRLQAPADRRRAKAQSRYGRVRPVSDPPDYLESYQPGVADGGNLADCVHCGSELAGLRRFFVDVHHANRPGLVPSKREVRDVDAVSAEDGAHLADDARLILVGDDQQCAGQRRLDVDAAYGHQTWVVRFEHGSFCPAFAVARVELE